MNTETYYPVHGRITIYSHNDHAKPVRYTATALTDFGNEGSVEVSYWKINDAHTEVTLTIVGDAPNHLNAYRESSFDRTYPVEITEKALPSPGRGFRWSEFHGCWVHNKTGHRFINK
jgi:hypothetical protein